MVEGVVFLFSRLVPGLRSETDFKRLVPAAGGGATEKEAAGWPPTAPPPAAGAGEEHLDTFGEDCGLVNLDEGADKDIPSGLDFPKG